MSFQVGVDIGGTCTDCVVLADDGSITLAKAFSTPGDFTGGIVAALDEVGRQLSLSRRELLEQTSLFLHSTTIAENAIVDGKLERTAILASRGFGATLWSTRGGYGRWSGLTDEEKRDPIATDKPTPLVPLTLVREIGERVTRDGTVVMSPDADEVATAVRELQAAGVNAYAVALLWSFLNPGAERAIGDTIKRLHPSAFVTLSSEISPTIGEYERTSTTVINAAVGPLVRQYLEDLAATLRAEGFSGSLLVMQAYGGLMEPERARERGAGLIESGPVSGLIGCSRLGRLIGSPQIIAADMGGTTFKAGAIREGVIEYQRESRVLRYHLSLPKLDVASFGLAGGSIISVDADTGAPRIGPRSAGSYPGPACYANGGDQPTVTDVDAVLGFMEPAYFLGGRAVLDVAAARRALEPISSVLDTPVDATAASLYRLVNSLIHDFLHKLTVQRGLDPRSFALFSTGGTAGMHLPAVGADLGVARIVIPHAASVYGAFGLVTSDIVDEQLITRPTPYPAPAEELADRFRSLTERVSRNLSNGGSGGEVRAEWLVDMRFRRQVHILTVPLAAGPASAMPPIDDAMLMALVERFERSYEQRYGPESAFREAGVELVSFRVRGSIPTAFTPHAEPVATGDGSQALRERRRALVVDEERFDEVPSYDFDALRPGDAVPGPALIWSSITTVAFGRAQTARLDAYRNIVIETSTS